MLQTGELGVAGSFGPPTIAVGVVISGGQVDHKVYQVLWVEGDQRATVVRLDLLGGVPTDGCARVHEYLFLGDYRGYLV